MLIVEERSNRPEGMFEDVTAENVLNIVKV